MSFDLSRAAWRAELPGGSDKLVLLALSDFANTEGQAWPSMETLAGKCSRSEQTVREAVQRLAKAGHITRTAREGRPSLYTIHPVTPAEIEEGSEYPEGSEDLQGYQNCEGSENHNPTPPDIHEGTPPDIHEGPLPISGPEPINNQSKNRSGNPQSREARAGRLPVDWRPNDFGSVSIAGQIAATRGEAWMRRCLETFANHWRAASGRSATKADWQATWANWVIEQDRRDGRNGANSRRSGWAPRPGMEGVEPASLDDEPFKNGRAATIYQKGPESRDIDLALTRLGFRQ